MPAFSVKKGLGSLTVLDDEQRNEIHERSLELLETMGMKVYNNEALEVLRRNGATVDTMQKIAKMPRGLVEEALGRLHLPRASRIK